MLGITRALKIYFFLFVSVTAPVMAENIEDIDVPLHNEPIENIAPEPFEKRQYTGEECGIKAYNAKQSPECGIASYRTGSGPVCGVKLYQKGTGPQCGEKCKTKIEVEFTFFGPVPKPVKVCSFKQCRHKDFGVESYNSCRNTAFGVESYKQCALKIFGVSEYHTCMIYMTRNEAKSFILATQTLAEDYLNIKISKESEVIDYFGQKKEQACFIKKYEDKAIAYDLIEDLKQRFFINYFESYSSDIICSEDHENLSENKMEFQAECDSYSLESLMDGAGRFNKACRAYKSLQLTNQWFETRIEKSYKILNDDLLKEDIAITQSSEELIDYLQSLYNHQ